ncbi:hypothetical protein CMI40_01570 [Candidatus Pacearchaeota archaeon]|jgi:hypothetical protein|nr:hypothetical protein [Candidatus Pacearchaeota archaeon]|tara:strand:- start:3415 stop:3837 length:423 start_codon:yes stop_codon:yes gene_type:complete
MKILGFNFTKISIEKSSDKLEKLKMNTNIDISQIKEVKSDFLKSKEEIIGVKFTYIVDYSPNIAKVELNGNILITLEPDMAKDVLKQWKDKKIPEEFRIVLFNIILKRSTIKSLQLEDEMNLPSHVNLPRISKTQEKQQD